MLKQCDESVSSFPQMDDAPPKQATSVGRRVQFHSHVEIIAITTVFKEDNYWYGEEHFESQRELKKDLLRLTDYTKDELWSLFGFIVEDEASAGCSKLNRILGIKSVLLHQDLQKSLGTRDPDVITQSYSKISRISLATASSRAEDLETELCRFDESENDGESKAGGMTDPLNSRVERRWM
jgi:hypothetical protein